MHTHQVHPARPEVRIFEVGPRDGLQNTPRKLSVAERVRLINRLADAGHTDIEVGSFVHPRWIPQMANTGEVLSQLKRRSGVHYWALIPNMKGLQNALEAGVENVAVFLSSSETHNRRNLNRTIAESLANVVEVMTVCRAEGLRIRAYISTVFGCPYEGDIDFDKVMELAQRLGEEGADHIALGDTTGMGEPADIQPKLVRAIERFGPDNIALHTHDTRGVGLVNTMVAYNAGVRMFDASIGGMGGCPYAPGASGNLATEDLANLLDGMRIPHDLDMNSLIGISQDLERSGIRITSTYYRYGKSQLEQAPELAVGTG